jgi:iron(III) transport system substrate-binding protein
MRGVKFQSEPEAIRTCSDLLGEERRVQRSLKSRGISSLRSRGFKIGLAAAAGAAALTAVPAVAGTGPAGAQSTSDATAALVREAKASGKPVVLYSGDDPTTLQSLATAFQKEYGIPVTVTHLVGTAEAEYQANAQAGSFPADVVMDAAVQSFFNDGAKQGWFLNLSTKNIPNMANLPKEFQYGTSVGVGTDRLNGVFVNTSQVPKAERPTTWQDLLKPQFKGEMVTDTPVTVKVELDMWIALDKVYGDNFIKKMAAQNIQWQSSLVTGVQEVSAGEKLVAFGANQAHALGLLTTDPSAPISKIVYLKPPDAGFIWTAGVSAKSPNPAGGKLFVNWMLTPEAQKLMNATDESPSVLPSVPVPGAPPFGKGFVQLSSNPPAGPSAHVMSLLGLAQ